MSELIGLIKFLIIMWLLVWFCTKDMKCNRSSDRYKEGIITEYLEEKKVVDKVGEADSLIIAGVISAPTATTKQATAAIIYPSKGLSFTTIFFCFCLVVLFYFAFIRRYEIEQEAETEIPESKPRIYYTKDTHTPYTKHLETDSEGNEMPTWEMESQKKKNTSRPKHDRTTDLTDEDRAVIKHKWTTKSITVEMWENIAVCKGYWATGKSTRKIRELMPYLSQTYINVACASFTAAITGDPAQNASQSAFKRASKSAFTVVLEALR
jgi:hypothetical protein